MILSVDEAKDVFANTLPINHGYLIGLGPCHFNSGDELINLTKVSSFLRGGQTPGAMDCGKITLLD